MNQNLVSLLPDADTSAPDQRVSWWKTQAHAPTSSRSGGTVVQSPEEQLQLPQQWCGWHGNNLNTTSDGISLPPCSGNKIDFGTRSNNHHLQSVLAEETFIAAFMDNDQYFFPPPLVPKVCSTVASQNRRVQEGSLARGPRKHSAGPRLCHAGFLYLRACLKRPIFSTLYLFSLLGRSRNGCSGGKLEANTACFLLWFYFAPTEHCSGSNCRLFFVVWQQ